MWRRHQPEPWDSRFPKITRATVRYWEIRRIIFNLLVLPPARFLYLGYVGIEEGVGDTRYLPTTKVVLLAVIAVVILNLCFSSVYVLEVILGPPAPQSVWAKCRVVVFLVGCFFGVVLGLALAREIGALEYTRTWLSTTPSPLD